jgi:hypothetical protein
MLYKILSRFDGRLLYECKAHSILECLRKGTAANVDLSYADLSSANLRYADLRYANLSYADLSSANLRSADLRSANLSSANLSSANLSSADLRSANLSSANLSYANLSSADLSSADLSSANLSCLKGKDRKKIISIIQCSGIGSTRRQTTAVIYSNFIEIRCGCFSGNFRDFSKIIKKTHSNNPRYLAEYYATLTWIELCAAAARDAAKE